MHISNLQIKNFKSIETLDVEFNSVFNVIIGQNNSGKTTIIEAMQLWKKCYDANITAKGDKFYSNTKNISFNEFEFLRIADDKDLFFSEVSNNKAELEITLVISEQNNSYSLGFSISKAGHIDNAYFQVSYLDKGQFQYFTALALSLGKSLKSMLSFSNTRPISNIIVKEPYMYIAQIRSKMQKGKGFEVLRNKIIRKDEVKIKIEEYLSTIFNKNVKFVEKDKDNREYIKLFVDIEGKKSDLLSQGSGFLQVADIFSSFEFLDSLLYILLIDEPDAHIHLGTQHKLIEQLRGIQNSQLFVITHNEKFVEQVNDNEIIFVNESDKSTGFLKPLENGAKKFVIENLVGEYSDIERLKNAKKILVVEGPKDKERIENLLSKFRQIKTLQQDNLYIIELCGVDSINEKLPSIIRAHNNLIKHEVHWILLRDTDCMPLSKLEDFKAEMLKLIHPSQKRVIFQDGYEFESSLFSNDEFIISLLNKHYSGHAVLSETTLNELKLIFFDARMRYDNDIHTKLSNNFIRQKESRSEKIYSKISFNQYLEDISLNKLHYIFCKDIIDKFLEEIHTKINLNSQIPAILVKQDSQSLFSLYLDSIVTESDIHPSHLNILRILTE